MTKELDFWGRDGLLVWRYRFTDCDVDVAVMPYIEGNKAASDELYVMVWGCKPGEGMPQL